MATALLTGPKHRTARLDETLRARADDVVVADSRAGLAGLAARLPRHSVGAWVQLPMDSETGAGTGTGAAWAPPLTERLETVALVAPLLAPAAAVVLVADDPGDPAHDERVAEGLCRLAAAALARADHADVTVSLLQDASPEAINLLLGSSAPPGGLSPLAELEPELDYADWRNDILNLTSTGEGTYFGWVNQAGAPRVGLLRGSVLSPLGGVGEAAVGWGRADPPAEALAAALIGDAIGGVPVDDGIVAAFAKEIVAGLAETGFELPAAEIHRWLHQHRPHPAAR